MMVRRLDPMNDQPDGEKLQVTLSPVLSGALTRLAQHEGIPVATFVAVLINEALAHRLLIRPFSRPD